MGYLPEDGVNNIYYKKYAQHNNYIIRVNFNTQKSSIGKTMLRLKMVFNGDIPLQRIQRNNVLRFIGETIYLRYPCLRCGSRNLFRLP